MSGSKENGTWMIAMGRNAICGWVYNWANRLTEVQEHSWGLVNWCSNSSLPDCQGHPWPCPFSIYMQSLFCCSVIMWPTHWGWKGLHYQPPTPNPPSSLRLGAIPYSFLASLLIRAIRDTWCWESQSHVFLWLSSFPGAQPYPGLLPSCRHFAARPEPLHVLFCYLSFCRPLFRSNSLTLFCQGFIVSWEEMRWGGDGEGVIAFALCPLSCLWFACSLPQGASASLGLYNRKEI